MTGFEKIIEGLKCTRDELALRVHLGSMDLRDEWTALEKRWHAFEAKAQLERDSENVSAAVQALAAELKTAYDHIRRAL